MAATGPSLTPEVAEACKGEHIIAVNDAYRLFPDAEVLYACDKKWWDHHRGAEGFSGEKWSSHGDDNNDNKLEQEGRWGLDLVRGRYLFGFSHNPAHIHYGSSSGFQAINLAMHFGATTIVLVGFNMQVVGPKTAQVRHFFGDHPHPLSNTSTFSNHRDALDDAAQTVPKGVQILNATPNSALKSYPKVELADALSPRPASLRNQHLAAAG